MAPVALQLVVLGSVMVTSPLPSGSMVISQYWLVPCVLLWAFWTSPPVTVNASSRRFAYPDLTLTLKSSSKVNKAPLWVAGTLPNVAVSATTGESAGGSSVGGSSCVPEGDSPFLMVPVPVASCSVAWLGLDRVRVRVSWLSSSESVRTVTWTV